MNHESVPCSSGRHGDHYIVGGLCTPPCEAAQFGRSCRHVKIVAVRRAKRLEREVLLRARPAYRWIEEILDDAERITMERAYVEAMGGCR